MSNRTNRPMWQRLKASKQRVKELETIVEQQNAKILDEYDRLTRVLILLENSVTENVALKSQLRAFQSLANEMDV